MAGEAEGEAGRRWASTIAAQWAPRACAAPASLGDCLQALRGITQHPPSFRKGPIFGLCLKNGGRNEINGPEIRNLVTVAGDPAIPILGPGYPWLCEA